MRECRSYACAARIGAGGRCAGLEAPVWWSCDRKAGARAYRRRVRSYPTPTSLWAAPGLGISSGFPESLRSCSLTTKSPSKAAGKSYTMASQESKALTLTVLGSGTYAFVLICAAPHCHVPLQGPILETGCLLKASARKFEHDWSCMLTV